MIARLHDGDGGRYLWLLNPSHEPVRVTATLAPEVAAASELSVQWSTAGEVTRAELVDGRSVDATIGARDGIVCRL